MLQLNSDIRLLAKVLTFEVRYLMMYGIDAYGFYLMFFRCF